MHFRLFTRRVHRSEVRNIHHCVACVADQSFNVTISLAGMIHKVGLLPPDNRQQVPFAYKMYTRTDEIGWCQSMAFKDAFCIDVPIEFVGVWYVPAFTDCSEMLMNNRDTVDSVGHVPKRLPFTASNTIIRTFRHALSLDEHRGKFKANLWNGPTVRGLKLSTSKSSPWSSRRNTVGSRLHKLRHIHRLESRIKWYPDDEKLLEKMEELHSSPSSQPTDVEEVWFSVRFPFVLRVYLLLIGPS